MLRLTLLLILGFLASPSLQKNCCIGPKNVFNGTKCVEGSMFLELNCEHMYVLNPNTDEADEFTIEDDFLIHNGEKIDNTKYCSAHSEGESKQIAVLCVEETINNSPTSYMIRASLLIISVFFLILTLIVYCLIPRLQDLQGKSTIAAIGALIFGFVTLAMLQFGADFGGTCKVAGYFMYISLLTAFFWLNVISFNIWRTTVKPDWFGTEKQWFYIYSAYGFGMPLLLTIITLIASSVEGNHINPNIGDNTCWFAGKLEAWAYFYSPILIIVCLNTVFFIWTSVHLYKQQSNTSSPRQIKILRYKFWLYLKLFFIMGLSWIFELLSSVLNDKHEVLDYLWFITDFVNALQGLLIFIILVVMRKKVLRDLAKRKLCNIPFPTSWETLEDDEDMVDEEENRLSSNRQTQFNNL